MKAVTFKGRLILDRLGLAWDTNAMAVKLARFAKVHQRMVVRGMRIGVEGFEEKFVPVRITIEPWSDSRSLKQNAYYWSVVLELLSEETGFTPVEVHEALKAKFLPSRTAPWKDLPIPSRSTTDLTTKEFEEYMAQVRTWAAQLGVLIPLPNEENGMEIE